MLEYLSDYRTQDRLRGVHYYPKGALCWFETNQYGDPLGSVYLIKFVPDMELLSKPFNERGYRQLLKKQKTKLSLKELFSREQKDMEVMTVVKPKLHKYKEGEK